MNRAALSLILFAAAGPLLPAERAAAKTDGAEESRAVRVVTSFYPIYIMALNVTEDAPGVSLENLTPPFSGCLHDYNLTIEDMKKLSNASIFLINGAGMESFANKVARRYPKLKTTPLSRGIPLIRDAAGRPNPHVWVSVSNAIAEVKNLGEAMEEFDPRNAGIYKANTARYAAKLERLRDRMKAELSGCRGKSVITFHEAFPYFAREFGLRIAGVVEREPGSRPSARELARAIDLVKKSGVKVIFTEPQYPAPAAEAIARETGAKIYVLDPASTGPDDPDAYIKIMERNMAALRATLL